MSGGQEAQKMRQDIVCLKLLYRGFDGAAHTGEIEVRSGRQADVQTFFRAAFELQFPFELLTPTEVFNGDDAQLMAANATSGYNFRTVAGTDRLSQHARGNAFDVNPLQNPYLRWQDEQCITAPAGARWQPDAPGALHAGHELVTLMEGLGWEWGGNWLPETDGAIDYQHFEWRHDD